MRIFKVLYKLILKKYYERKKDYYYPEIVIFSLNFQKFTDFENKKDTEGYINYIMTGINFLQNAGADFIVMSANSPHAVFEYVSKKAKVPMISIAEVTANKAKILGMKKLLLLGIKFTMQSGFYKDICNKHGIEVTTPSEKEQDDIDNIVFDELCLGIFKDESKNRLLRIMDSYKTDGVILGCTELPLIIKQQDSTKKLFDTLDMHTEAVLEYAMNDEQNIESFE